MLFLTGNGNNWQDTKWCSSTHSIDGFAFSWPNHMLYKNMKMYCVQTKLILYLSNHFSPYRIYSVSIELITYQHNPLRWDNILCLYRMYYGPLFTKNSSSYSFVLYIRLSRAPGDTGANRPIWWNTQNVGRNLPCAIILNVTETHSMQLVMVLMAVSTEGSHGSGKVESRQLPWKYNSTKYLAYANYFTAKYYSQNLDNV